MEINQNQKKKERSGDSDLLEQCASRILKEIIQEVAITEATPESKARISGVLQAEKGRIKEELRQGMVVDRTRLCLEMGKEGIKAFPLDWVNGKGNGKRTVYQVMRNDKGLEVLKSTYQGNRLESHTRLIEYKSGFRPAPSLKQVLSEIRLAGKNSSVRLSMSGREAPVIRQGAGQVRSILDFVK